MSTCSYCGGELTAGSQKCDYCGAPVLHKAPQQNYNQPQRFNQAPGFNNSQSFNQAPNYNQAPNFNNSPSYNQVPDYNQAPGFNNPPSFNQSFNPPPVPNKAADARCPICGALIVPGSDKCPYCNGPIAHQPSYAQPMGYGQNQPMGYGQPQGFNQGFNQSFNQPMNNQTQSRKTLGGTGLIRSVLVALFSVFASIFSPLSANALCILNIFLGYKYYKESKNALPMVIAGCAEVIIIFISLAYLGANGTLM